MPTCPGCGRGLGRRCRRSALELCLGFIRIYPFRCMGCGHRFLAFRPGERYRQHGTRRSIDRVPVSIPCDVTRMDGVIAGTCVELSLQGGSIDTHPPPPPGTEVSVVLHATNVGRPVRIPKAVVRWSRPGRFGVMFGEIGPDDAGRLRQVVLTAPGYSPDSLRTTPVRRHPRPGAPWIVITLLTVALLVALVLTLRF